MKTNEVFIEQLRKWNACEGAHKWARKFETFQEAWDKCERPDWMFWLMRKMINKGCTEEEIIFATCKCARLVLKYVPKGENRPRIAILTNEYWAKGNASIEEVIKATNSAYTFITTTKNISLAAYNAGAATTMIYRSITNTIDYVLAAAIAKETEAFAADTAADTFTAGYAVQKAMCRIIRNNIKINLK